MTFDEERIKEIIDAIESGDQVEWQENESKITAYYVKAVALALKNILLEMQQQRKEKSE